MQFGFTNVSFCGHSNLGAVIPSVLNYRFFKFCKLTHMQQVCLAMQRKNAEFSHFNSVMYEVFEFQAFLKRWRSKWDFSESFLNAHRSDALIQRLVLWMFSPLLESRQSRAMSIKTSLRLLHKVRTKSFKISISGLAVFPHYKNQVVFQNRK